MGINGFDHRQFLNAFYTGRFEGSFARGLPFQFNPRTRDARISGTCASLAGLEKALREETDRVKEGELEAVTLPTPEDRYAAAAREAQKARFGATEDVKDERKRVLAEPAEE